MGCLSLLFISTWTNTASLHQPAHSTELETDNLRLDVFLSKLTRQPISFLTFQTVLMFPYHCEQKKLPTARNTPETREYVAHNPILGHANKKHQICVLSQRKTDKLKTFGKLIQAKVKGTKHDWKSPQTSRRSVGAKWNLTPFCSCLYR